MGEIPWNSAPWDKIFSTENNESAYAFLQDLLRAKNLPSRDRTDMEQECFRIRRWLLQHAYNPKINKVIRGFHPGAGPDACGARLIPTPGSWPPCGPQVVHNAGIPLGKN